ncbi:uncharacterized protein LOC126369338 [Pectinophora gossypiella]|uniref:uncharacterized protein LOC126369338 n=1 Tax=Pectinophora gossypiella TaxID=13191 RepID=UPI00214E5865|nr:uncharacterized protein LOC126369338 [Pectinophora gossypiella]
MSRRERKTDRQNCPLSLLEEARKRVNEGESKRSVAKSLGMAESTLRKRLLRTSIATKLGRYDLTFSKEVEQEFCNYLMHLDDMYFGMTAKNLRILAFEFAERNNISHRFNRDAKAAGKDWLRGFLKRHPQISLRQPTSTSIARAMGFNRPQVERFYINLSALMDKHNFPPSAIYNMDETGVSTVPNKAPKVLTLKGKRSVNKISSAERGTNVTVVNAVSATGHFVPPVFIFGRKRMKAELLDGAPSGSVGMVSDSSFINCDLFLNWLTHFKDHVRPTDERPILLILDNHVSHCSIKAIDFFRANNIIALTIPPHSSHKLQPLDKGFHTVLKKYFANECEKWMRNHPGRAITVFQITAIFNAAFGKAATIACATESFKTTGIWPYNPDVFSEADFLASAVTDREFPNDGSENTAIADDNSSGENSIPSVQQQQQPVLANQDSSLGSGKKANSTDKNLMPSTQQQQQMLLPNQDSCSSVTSTNNSNETPDTVSAVKQVSVEKNPVQEAVGSFSNGHAAVVLNVKNSPLAKETPTTANPRCKTEEAIVKKLLDISPLPKAPRKNTTRKHKKSEVISSSPYKTQLETDQELKNKPKIPRLDFKKPKKPKNAPKIKKWKCGGCNEIYKEPIEEDWIECSGCKNWWHEKCTAYTGVGAYICDFCVDK